MTPLLVLPGLWLFDPAGPLPVAVSVDERGEASCSCVDEGERQGCEHLTRLGLVAA